MLANGVSALVGALILFLTYFANVALGAADMTRFMSDVGEMLMLFAAVIVFVIGILRREAVDKNSKS